MGLSEVCGSPEEDVCEDVGENSQEFEDSENYVAMELPPLIPLNDIFRIHTDFFDLARLHAALFNGFDWFLDPRGPRGWGHLDEDLDKDV